MTVDAQILTALRAALPSGVSAPSLAVQLALPPSVLKERLAELRQLGYDIEFTPHLGYRLRSAPDLLHSDDLASRTVGVRVVGRDIQIFQETGSTNDIVERLARDGVREGVVVFAESQTRGRGRLGRKWVSPAGLGLWFSVLLRPQLPVNAMTQITLMAATAVARAIRVQTGLVPQIKWPNDILINGRKVVGILTELSAEMDQVRYVIVGIGVDVNVLNFPPELLEIATSLSLAAGRSFVRAEIAAALLRELDRDYTRIQDGDFAVLAEEWERQCVTLGQRVQIHLGDRQLSGRAEALDADGALLLRTDFGRLERIIGGDVRIEK